MTPIYQLEGQLQQTNTQNTTVKTTHTLGEYIGTKNLEQLTMHFQNNQLIIEFSNLNEKFTIDGSAEILQEALLSALDEISPMQGYLQPINPRNILPEIKKNNLAEFIGANDLSQLTARLIGNQLIIQFAHTPEMFVIDNFTEALLDPSQRDAIETLLFDLNIASASSVVNTSLISEKTNSVATKIENLKGSSPFSIRQAFFNSYGVKSRDQKAGAANVPDIENYYSPRKL